MNRECVITNKPINSVHSNKKFVRVYVANYFFGRRVFCLLMCVLWRFDDEG
jgi:hypothetical protein